MGSIRFMDDANVAEIHYKGVVLQNNKFNDLVLFKLKHHLVTSLKLIDCDLRDKEIMALVDAIEDCPTLARIHLSLNHLTGASNAALLKLRRDHPEIQLSVFNGSKFEETKLDAVADSIVESMIKEVVGELKALPAARKQGLFAVVPELKIEGEEDDLVLVEIPTSPGAPKI